MNDTALAKEKQTQNQSLQKVATGNFGGSAGPMSLQEIREWGLMFFESKLFTDLASAAQAMVKIKAGEELGFKPFASISGVHIIKGKPSIGATLQASLIKDAPNYRYKVHSLDDTGCKLEFFEKVDGKWGSIGISEFTQANAAAAGLAGQDGTNKAMYKKYGRNMLFSRAVTNGMKWYTPDLLRSCDSAPPAFEEFDVDEVIAETVEDVQPDHVDGEIVEDEEVTITDKTSEPEAPITEYGGNPVERRDAKAEFSGPVDETANSEESVRVDLVTGIGEYFTEKLGGDADEIKKFLKGRDLAQMDASALKKLYGDLREL